MSSDLMEAMKSARRGKGEVLTPPERPSSSAGLKINEAVFTPDDRKKIDILWQEYLLQQEQKTVAAGKVRYRCLEMVADPNHDLANGPAPLVPCGGITEAPRPEDRTGSADFIYCPHATERHRGQLTPMEMIR